MQIDKRYKLHYACSDDEYRPALNAVHLEEDYLIATNGHILVMVKPDDCENDIPGNIPKEVFKEITKGKKSEPAELHCKENDIEYGNNGHTTNVKKITDPFPDYKAVLPKECKPVFVLKFNFKELEKLYKACGGPDGFGNIRMTFTNDNVENESNGKFLVCTGPIPVKVDKEEQGNDAKAILMPARI